MVKKFGEQAKPPVTNTDKDESLFSPFEDKNKARLDAIGDSVWGGDKSKNIVPPEEQQRMLEETVNFFKTEAVDGAEAFGKVMKVYLRAMGSKSDDGAIEYYQELKNLTETLDKVKLMGVIAAALANFAYATGMYGSGGGLGRKN